MADVFTKTKRSEVMSLIRAKNTKPEIALRKLVSSEFYPLGYRYKIHYGKLPGKPDVAFVSRKVAIFVDGSFWHGYKLVKKKQLLTEKYWLPKIQRNMERDRENNRSLKRMGWKVVRVWEHDIFKSPDRVLDKVRRALRR